MSYPSTLTSSVGLGGYGGVFGGYGGVRSYGAPISYGTSYPSRTYGSRTYGATTTATSYDGATTTYAAAPAEEAEQPASGFRGLASGFFQGSVNIAERLTGRDLDGDGDVGVAGHNNRAR